MKLPQQPKAPKGVKYALTVPQSVLFADLSLQGNRRAVFKRLGMDYQPAYVSIDAGGAMSWNYDNDKDFDAVLLRNGSAGEAISDFIGLMERTAQNLDAVSKDIGSKRVSKAGIPKTLRAYWRAYEEHMTSLFTFWNVERLLSDTLTAELKKAGRQGEIDDGLARYLKPDKPNYFIKERAALNRLIDKFKITSSTTLAGSKGLAVALEEHRDKYGFLLAPFNLDNPLSVGDLLERAKELANEPVLAKDAPDDFADLSPGLRRLALLAQRFTFWKSQRLDLFALADSRVKELYREAAAALSLKPDDFFAMTADEMVESLKSGKAAVSGAVLEQRQKAYCLILFDGKIGFYKPSAGQAQDLGGQVSELTGVAASTGVVTGRVRLINDLKDAKQLKRGEVIVTAMTRPEMGAALDRAVGFVTDEGGLLCHAAIISREMKKPCVIATGNATKILKDGQNIEVDGSKGIVKVLGD